MARVLARGDWAAIRWVRNEVGDAALRELMYRCHGRWLTRPQIRFWQLVLDLEPEAVEQWLHSPGRQAWDGRRQ